jgi:hypothetical protein
MTFEEFLIKKKIDPVQLQTKEQSFFSEFESHFLQMGEKSFDHSKKFWFNKLRRTYHLKEEPKPVNTETKIDKFPDFVQEKSRNEPINDQKSAYVPRFKATATQNTEPDAPPSYIPRFKAAIKTTEKIEDTNQNIEPKSEEKAKPVYKPRFKAQIPLKEEKPPEITADPNPQSTEPAKASYKPRFKPGMIKKNPDSE